jgi:uncharacterized membrane protein
MMTLLRFVAVLALAVWVGGLVTLGALTAPVLFTVLESQDALGGREMAGLLFGSVFREFQFLGWAMGGVLLTSLGLRAALGPRPQRMDIRTGTLGPIAALAAADPVRVEFGRLHGISNVLALITVVGGIGLIWVELRDQH